MKSPNAPHLSHSPVRSHSRNLDNINGPANTIDNTSAAAAGVTEVASSSAASAGGYAAALRGSVATTGLSDPLAAPTILSSLTTDSIETISNSSACETAKPNTITTNPLLQPIVSVSPECDPPIHLLQISAFPEISRQSDPLPVSEYTTVLHTTEDKIQSVEQISQNAVAPELSFGTEAVQQGTRTTQLQPKPAESATLTALRNSSSALAMSVPTTSSSMTDKLVSPAISGLVEDELSFTFGVQSPVRSSTPDPSGTTFQRPSKL